MALGSGYGNEDMLPKQSVPTAAVNIATGGSGGGSSDKRNDPSTVSGDHAAMAPYWKLVADFDGGLKAMQGAADKYLPRFERESGDAYNVRLSLARFTNIFGDICENLAAKPFTKQVRLTDDASPAFEELAKDIDGCGNSIHTFAAHTFHDGIRRAIDWILVDFTKATPAEGRALSQQEEAAQGLRPYWVHIPAPAVLDVKSDFVGGQEIITHFRFCEDTIEQDGFAEVEHKRIRAFNRELISAPGAPKRYADATWALYEETQDTASGRKLWVLLDSGPVTIGVIPAAPFAPGLRCGRSWQFKPPMKAAADLQLEHYQAESGLKWITVMTAYPMLSASGVAPQMEKGKAVPAPIGPRTVLYAPPTGETRTPGKWEFIEPAGSSLTFSSGEVDKIEGRLRELGRQPLTANSGNLTVIAAAVAGQKANSAIQAWAFSLEVAIDQALKLTALWLNEAASPGVVLHTDFNVELDDKGPDWLTAMRANGDLSRDTMWEEGQRRGFLSADFDPDAEAAALDQEKADAITTSVETMAALGVSPPANDGGGGSPPAPPARKPAPPRRAPKPNAA